MSSVKNKVLGRGLGNLIPGSDRSSESKEDATPKEVKISEIKPNPYQPRKTFSAESLQELASTIQTHGVIQPIVVKKSEAGFTLVSGERRLRAAKLAGFQKIPVVIKNYSDTEMMEIAIIENLQREDLNPIEEAQAYQTLMEKSSLKMGELAQKLGKNRSTIANLVRLLSFPTPILNLLKDGKLKEGQARPLLSLTDPKKQIDLAQRIVEEQWSARMVENHVSGSSSAKKGKVESAPKAKDPSILKIESKLRNKLSAKLEITHDDTQGKGKIQIFYNNVTDLERILENLGIKA